MSSFVNFPPLSRIGTAHITASFMMMLIVIAFEGAIAGLFVNQVDLSTPSSVASADNIPLSCINSSNTENTGSTNNARSLLVYLIIFILAQLFQLYIVVDALREQNTIQVFMHCLFVAAMLAYSITQYIQLRDLLNGCTIAYLSSSNLDFSASASTCEAGCQLFKQIQPLIAVVIAILGTFCLVFFYLAFKLYLEFGWKIYKKIGADPKMRSMYRAVQIFLMLLKLDIFFIIAFSIQFIYLVLQSGDPEYALTIVLILVTIPVCYIAYKSIAYENYYVVIVWMLILVAVFAYYLFKIVRIYEPSQSQKYVGSSKFLTLFAVLSLVVTVLSFTYTTICMMNFGRGLKPHLVSGASKARGDSVLGGDDLDNGRKRMELE